MYVGLLTLFYLMFCLYLAYLALRLHGMGVAASLARRESTAALAASSSCRTLLPCVPAVVGWNSKVGVHWLLAACSFVSRPCPVAGVL